MMLGAGFVRVSTGSQDETSQVKVITKYAEDRGIAIVKWFKLHGYSASHGTQEPALREAISDIQRGDYAGLLVTDSSRLDRREDLDAQAEILLSIRSAGGDVISVAEPQFGKSDFAGRIVTLVAQHANAEKSRTVKHTTYRGISMIRDNGAFRGNLPTFWELEGTRYAKRAYCANPDAVKDIYRRVANGEALARIARRYNLWLSSLKNVIQFEANHTGIIICSHTYEGVTETWPHEVTPVVDPALWWRANKVLEDNKGKERVNKGGRPVASPDRWISGVLDCPGCGARTQLQTGMTNPRDKRTGAALVQKPRTPVLRCGGLGKERKVCGIFKGATAQPIIDAIAGMFEADTSDILAYQRVAGNSHELDGLNADLRKIQARLSATEDDDELDALVAERKAVKARIEGFVVVPDSYDYGPAGGTVSQMWKDGDVTVQRGMARAVKKAWGLSLVGNGELWGIAIGSAGPMGAGDATGIVDLGNGLCFRRKAA
jgi:DNA invertase Pin-like site-specific DNA recombinase